MSKKAIYRPNVAMIVVSNNYPEKKEIFVARRNDMSDVWQFPQGGIDAGETTKEAMFRELEEEIGTNKVKIVAEYPEWISYDFPKKIKRGMKPFTGQKQRYYLVKLKKSAKINIHTKHPEFSEYKFTSLDDVLAQSSSFKAKVYKKVIKHFKKEGLL